NTELRRGGAETKTMLLFSVVLCAIFVVLRVKVFLSIQNIAFDAILHKQNVEFQEEPASAH
ncbi:MAG: hypothetical protein NTY46_14820, partial [Candidatus Sumerlaeota bacterium]|nr:hypothetical protein [Candidatus Sumerlaeota bacterium]